MEIAIEIVDLPINSMVDLSIVMLVRLPGRATFFPTSEFSTLREAMFQEIKVVPTINQLDGSDARCLRGFFAKAEHGFAETLKYSGTVVDKNRLIKHFPAFCWGS